MSGGQHLGITAYIRTRLGKKSGEDGHLRQEHQSRYQPHTEGVYHSLRHHRTQGLGERNAIVLGENTATGHFSHTGNHQIGSVRYEDGIDTMRGSGILVQGSNNSLSKSLVRGSRICEVEDMVYSHTFSPVNI